MNNDSFKTQEKGNAQKLVTSLEALHVSNKINLLNNTQNEIIDVKKILSNQSNSVETKENLPNDKNNLHSDGQKNIPCCTLTLIPVEVFSEKYLTVLNLSNHFLDELPREIGNLCNLLTLKLSGNKLKHLPQSLKNVQHLNYLDLGCNNFTEVPEILFYSLRTLTVLDLSCNQISKFNDPPACLNKLVVLNLSDNCFMQIPIWIFDNLCQLQYLNISKNKFFLDVKFANYSKTGIYESLQLLNVENCNLSCKYFENFSVFKKLKVLYLGNGKELDEKAKGKNYMGNLSSEALKVFQEITKLHLQNVQIATLPTDFNILKNIEELDLSCNLLSWLPDCFCELISLKILYLTSNQLFFLPNNMGKLVNLKQIHLENNNISKIPDSFYNLTNLEYIDLYNNKIQKVDSRIFKEKNLKGIDLELNYLVFDFCENGVDIDEIKVLYDCLRDSFRKHFCHTDSRCDLQKTDKLGSESSSDSHSNRNTTSISSCESELLSDTEDLSQNLAQPSSSQTEDDDWDLHQNEKDELFDPNGIYSFEEPKSHWKLDFKNNYCPAVYHSSFGMKSYLKNFRSASKAENIEEGQFDSD